MSMPKNNPKDSNVVFWSGILFLAWALLTGWIIKDDQKAIQKHPDKTMEKSTGSASTNSVIVTEGLNR